MKQLLISKLMEKKNAPKDLGTKQADIIREPLVYFYFKSYQENRSPITNR